MPVVILDSETPEPIQLKFRMFDYVHRLTHMQNTVAAVKKAGLAAT